jgi:iron(III) transport system ATP-binding protein
MNEVLQMSVYSQGDISPYLEIHNLSKTFGNFNALRDISLEISDGEFVCFLGPSGCGKTTLLRCIAGLENQTSGKVLQQRKDISKLPPSSRDFGIVFQSYALFPNLTVSSNIDYGLINKKWEKSAIANRVSGLLDMVGLQDHANKYPSQLSGGEQQRVALARALATSPGLLLLDEPLSALDAKVRIRLRKQIKDLHRSLNLTTIMVTHDQEEAQSMADRIFVMNAGEIIQSGTPREIYHKANSPFIADFIGITNFLDAEVVSNDQVRVRSINLQCDTSKFDKNSPVQLAFRPESVKVVAAPDKARNQVRGELADIEFLGSFQRLYIIVPELDSETLMVDISTSSNDTEGFTLGQLVTVELPKNAITVYSRG